MTKKLDFKQPPNLPLLEEEVQQFWHDIDAFKKSVEMRPSDKAYVFYDGPPFATGMPHYGHLLASTTKDVVPRYWTMKGYRVDRVWGWDCHGLPIENMIEKQLDIKGGKKGIEALGIDKFNQACRVEVLRLDTEWEKIIDRLGRWVDFEHSYKTMDTSYMESVWWGFKQLYDKDLVYQGDKVILYCPRCSTPLSNFEIAMDNSYVEITEPSNVYKYKVVGEDNTYLLAWSTTPWNKLATPALAVNPNLTYIKVKQGDEYYILAETTQKMLTDEAYQIIDNMTGEELATLTFELHYDFYPDRKHNENVGQIITDNFVTAEEGTGVVTLAVYGEDDYRVMKDHHIQLVKHVDEEGKLKPEVTPWAGLDILTANPLVNEDLAKRGLVYRELSHTHSVATCYRCGTRLYYAPLPAWFINIQIMKDQLIAENENINWYPEHLKQGRFKKGLETAPDWNISRSRYWGTPMPIWKGDNNSLRVIGSLAELKQWAVDPAQTEQLTDIHREFLDDLEVWVDDAKTIKGRRVSEVFDCWVESGSMPFASVHYPFENKEFFDRNYPAQFVSEYIAQTRAWFYTMHVMSIGIFGKPPFENVLTTGTILAEDGSKMSKSKKNYPDPLLLIKEYGVDSLRLYLMSSTVMKGENLNFSEKEVADIRRNVFVIWWNLLSFYKTFVAPTGTVTRPNEKPTHILDQWLLSRVDTLIEETTQLMDGYDVVRSSRNLMNFVNEVSTWYLRLSRDRLRSGDTQTGQVFGYALYTLAQLFSPFAPFFSELVHHTLVDEITSIHHTDWPTINADTNFLDSKLIENMNVVRKVVELGHAQRKEFNLKVRQPLSKLTAQVQEVYQADQLAELVKQELNVKEVEWQIGNFPEPVVTLSTQLTPELIAEGEAREVVRSIQNLRKKAGLQPHDVVSVTLPSWPTEWETYIKEKTNTTTLVVGDTISLM